MDSNETQQAFLQAFAAMTWPQPQAVEYRVYYDPDTGSVLEYTNDIRDGHWILVDKDTWAAARWDLKVKNGRLIKPRLQQSKLMPDSDGKPCHPEDITLVVKDNQAHVKWNVQIYED